MAARIYLKPTDVAKVAALSKAGHDNRFISNQTGIKMRTVQRWILKLRDSPDGELPLHRPRSGRPKKTSQRTLNIIRRQVEANPTLTSRVIKNTNPDILGNVTLRTVQRILHHGLGYTKRTARNKPLVTYKQRIKRLEFARKHMHWNLRQWKNIIWSDESMFTVSTNNAKKVYMRPDSDPFDPKYTYKTIKHPDKLMVWGCFNYRGVGKIVVLPRNQTMNKESYLELISTHLYDSFRKCKVRFDKGIYMQDGATCHTAKIIKEYFFFVNINYIEKWPGNSPDINPIENLWAIFKSKLRERDTSSIPKLQAAIYDVWNKLDRKVLKKLASSIPKRLREVVRRKGYPTKY